MGKVYEYLASLHVEYCALRPTSTVGIGVLFFPGWSLYDGGYHGRRIKTLTDPVIDHTNPVMVGPELLSYAEARR